MITNSKFNQKLITELRKRIPEKGVLVDLLINSFSLGKEAAYRRLRGDVPFSFTEACVLAEKLNISLDNIMGLASGDQKILFEMDKITEKGNTVDDFGKEYYNVLYSTYLNVYERFAGKPSLYIISAFNTIPPSLFYPYPYLSQFRAFKWIYQLLPGGKLPAFMPRDHDRRLEEKQKASYRLHKNAEITFIFGREIFIILMKQIQHFYHLHFISDEQLIKLKEELLDMVGKLEQAAASGQNMESKRTWLYLSNLDFENNYTYMGYEGHEEAFMHIFQIHSISSTNRQACQLTRDWLESLIKYSTLISVSGEKERILFFEKQREYIDILGSENYL